MAAPQRVNATMNLPTVSEYDLQDECSASQGFEDCGDASNSSAQFMRDTLQALKSGQFQALHAAFQEQNRQLAEATSCLSKPSSATLAAGASTDAASAGAIPQQQIRSACASVISAAEVSIDLEFQSHSDVQQCSDQHHGRPSKLSL
eukprot:TRINITY_DN106062_c0_g1_i1.p1 TRINITY_DN106062_c0_g1~~TRINITY_DN106062_c0_g1_i1.p1  ORF type:complete len:147 (+),score=31.94 TRINITY_DN106062_c0_g1_i1:91-531(+)